MLEILANYLDGHRINNLFIFHIHTFIEFAFITTVYGNLIRAKAKRVVLTVLTSIFLLASIALISFHQNIFEFNSVQRHIEGFLVTLILLFYLYETNVRQDQAENKPIKTLTWGLLLYFNTNLFLFMFADRILTTGSGDLWILHGVMNIILNCVFTYVISSKKRA